MMMRAELAEELYPPGHPHHKSKAAAKEVQVLVRAQETAKQLRRAQAEPAQPTRDQPRAGNL